MAPHTWPIDNTILSSKLLVKLNQGLIVVESDPETTTFLATSQFHLKTIGLLGLSWIKLNGYSVLIVGLLDDSLAKSDRFEVDRKHDFVLAWLDLKGDQIVDCFPMLVSLDIVVQLRVAHGQDEVSPGILLVMHHLHTKLVWQVVLHTLLRRRRPY